MKTEIGWVNEDGTETLNNDFDNSTEFETAESMVAMLNSTMSDECWFAMAGDEQCPNPCADCEGAMQTLRNLSHGNWSRRGLVMGLDCSHDAFHGSYPAFNRFRQIVAKAMGGSYPPHYQDDLDKNTWYWGKGYTSATHPGLQEFFNHNDCDGSISPKLCKLIADEMEELLPKIVEFGVGWGHIQRDGGYGKVAERFIAGCRAAAKERRRLLFR